LIGNPVLILSPADSIVLCLFAVTGVWLDGVGGKKIDLADHLFTPLPMMALGLFYIVIRGINL
jgi:hypothetical protein